MTQIRQARRSMMTGLGAAFAAAALTPSAAGAQVSRTRFEPARHAQDAWLDSVRGKHRIFIDAATPRGAAEAMLYANNLYEANKTGYALPESDVVIVAGLRHFATAFAFNDAIWKKYGSLMSTMLEFTDPKTKQAPSANVLFSTEYGMQLPNLGATIGSVVARGTRFAVCDMATHFFAQQVAMTSGGSADAIYTELVANLIPNSHLVSAGVVAVNRSQEYGYTLLNTL